MTPSSQQPQQHITSRNRVLLLILLGVAAIFYVLTFLKLKLISQ